MNRIQLAQKSLLGTSIGDAFGESFFGPAAIIAEHIVNKTIPPTSWQFTDDTIMSLAVFEELECDGRIDQDRLVKKICRNHALDPNRGYGATARRILREIEEGHSWQTVSASAFGGQGSMGNGAAMRTAPVGAYYFDDINKARNAAVSSAEVTHTNIEAMEGAVAVATAAALAASQKINNTFITPEEFIRTVAASMQTCETKAKVLKAKDIPAAFHTGSLISILGNGTAMTAADTVPFVIWCAAHHLYNFENALWKAVSVLGDRDTICAMVGGITILAADEKTIPADWKNATEDILVSVFRNK